MEKKQKILLGTLIPVGILLVIVVSGLIFLNQSYAPLMEAYDAMESTFEISVSRNDNMIKFDPSNRTLRNGFIFYPGGNVEPESYSIIARDVALNCSIVVVIVEMPFDLAVFAPERGAIVMEEYPFVTNWFIGGHSLGGAMASKYLYSEPSLFTGLILLASYPANNNNLSRLDIPVLSIYGSEDGIVDIDISDTLTLLPSMTTMVEINGGNHANFGSYWPQKGDNPAGIPRAEQQSITINTISEFIKSIID